MYKSYTFKFSYRSRGMTNTMCNIRSILPKFQNHVTWCTTTTTEWGSGYSHSSRVKLLFYILQHILWNMC